MLSNILIKVRKFICILFFKIIHELGTDSYMLLWGKREKKRRKKRKAKRKP